MRFYCDSDLAHLYGLTGNDLLVYACLCCKCANGSWTGNYATLADLSCCGSKPTAIRSCRVLIAKGLISVTDGCFCVLVRPTAVQNEPIAVQNEPIAVQNEPVNNKLLINNIKEKVGKKENQPTELEVYQFAQSKNIPQLVAQKWFLYWQQHNWHQQNGQPMGNWQPCLEGYWLREHPSLSPSPATTVPSPSQADLVRQERERERAQRQREDAEYEAHRAENEAAAERFFAKFGKRSV